MGPYLGDMIWGLGLVTWISIAVAMYSKHKAWQTLLEYMLPGPTDPQQRKNALAYIDTRNKHLVRFPHGTIRYSVDTFIVLNSDGSGTLHVRDVDIEKVFQLDWPGHQEPFADIPVSAEDVEWLNKQLWPDLAAKLHFTLKRQEGETCAVS